MASDYADKKVQILAINVDEDRTEAKKLLDKLNLPKSSMDILWDTKSKVVSVYDIQSMPSSFIVDSEGIIRFIHVGFRSRDPAEWRQEIDGLRK